MGRPRKNPLPDSTAPAPELAAPEPDDEEEEDESPDELEPEHLVGLALDNPRMKLTPPMLAALNQAWKDNVRADDDEGKAHARRIAARLKRASHGELHPGCQKITVTIPALKRRNGGVWHVKINERPYVGECTVWECEARTLLELVHRYQRIEDERMDDSRAQHPTFDLDTGTTLAERARAIQRA